ncbi:hypothetical protein L7F22_016725 [Adiantum nelumboides]|nr:hypothetical protein [Adiantum nelumboides]
MADNNKENRMSIADFDFAHKDATDDTSMLINYLVTRLHQAMGNPALQGEVQQQLHAYGILPPPQQERDSEKYHGETSKRELSTVREVENPYQELKQLLEGKPSSKKKCHAQHERSPSREREGSDSHDESMKDVAPRRRRAQRSPTPTNQKRSPHSPHRRESKREEKSSRKKKERKRSPSSPSSSPSSSCDEGSGCSSQEKQRRGHQRSYAAWKRSSKLKKFQEGGKNISFLTYDGTIGATNKLSIVTWRERGRERETPTGCYSWSSSIAKGTSILQDLTSCQRPQYRRGSGDLGKGRALCGQQTMSFCARPKICSSPCTLVAKSIPSHITSADFGMGSPTALETFFWRESVVDACLRGIREELGHEYGAVNHVQMLQDTYAREVQERASLSYPGLMTCFVLHHMVAIMKDLPIIDFATEENELCETSQDEQTSEESTEAEESGSFRENISAIGDLSLKRLDEYHSQLQALQKEKSERLHKVLDYVGTVYEFCAVLGMDCFETVTDVHPSLDDSTSGQSKSMSNETLEKLAKTVTSLKQEKKQRIKKLQDLKMSLIKMWSLMDTPREEQQLFQHVTCIFSMAKDGGGGS